MYEYPERSKLVLYENNFFVFNQLINSISIFKREAQMGSLPLSCSYIDSDNNFGLEEENKKQHKTHKFQRI